MLRDKLDVSTQALTEVRGQVVDLAQRGAPKTRDGRSQDHSVQSYFARVNASNLTGSDLLPRSSPRRRRTKRQKETELLARLEELHTQLQALSTSSQVHHEQVNSRS